MRFTHSSETFNSSQLHTLLQPSIIYKVITPSSRVTVEVFVPGVNLQNQKNNCCTTVLYTVTFIWKNITKKNF